MNLKNESIFLQWLVLLVALSVAAMAGGQKPHASAPAPAPHAAAPSHPAPPPSRPAAPPSHAGAPNNAPHGGNPNAAHGGGNANTNNNRNNTPGGNNNRNNAAGGNNKNGSNTAAGNNNGNNRNNNAAGNNTRGANNAAKGPNNQAHGANNAANNNGNGRGGTQANGGKNGHPGANTAAHETHTNGPNTAARGNNGGKGAMANRRGPPVHTREITARNGAKVQASYRGGHVRAIQTRNMRIEHGFRGERRIVAERNGRRVVVLGGRRGYMQRAYFNRGGRAYIQRTYYYGGRPYAYAYRTYYWGGRPYYGYAPAYYYRPVYYGWAYNPWPQPVYYNWGYYQQPWYGYYNPYYQPYPSYPTASSWLTDYITAENLKAAYEAAHPAQSVLPDSLKFAQPVGDWLAAKDFDLGYEGRMGGGTTPAGKTQPALTPEVKQELADAVKQEIADEKAASESSSASAATTAAKGDEVPPSMDAKHRIFVVTNDLDLTDANGNDCQLTAGDVIKRTGDSVDDDNNVAILVRASKKDECPAGTESSVDAGDLQEMHNHLRETMDRGLKELADNSGKNGLPKAPDTSTQNGEVPAPAPDSNVDSELQQTQKDADQTEADVPKDDAGGDN
jgi:hypothetical protein